MLSNAENRDKFRSELTENFNRDVKERDVKPCERKRKTQLFKYDSNQKIFFKRVQLRKKCNRTQKTAIKFVQN